MPAAVHELAGLLRERGIVALVGAGCSTESGIPDYRGPGTRDRARNPMKFAAFVGGDEARRRYWARSMVGWPRFRAARPNAAHRALARLEEAGVLKGLITQNVDGLHQTAGSRRVVELHGALREVRCLECERIEARDGVQSRLSALNPRWPQRDAELAPDGDADLAGDLAEFRVAPCEVCGGVLKPHVVFFGESVPLPVTRAAWTLFDEAEALLVVGSSLTVFSGYRFVREAAKRSWPIGMVNLGETRGRDLIDVHVDANVVQALPALADVLLD